MFVEDVSTDADTLKKHVTSSNHDSGLFLAYVTPSYATVEYARRKVKLAPFAM